MPYGYPRPPIDNRCENLVPLPRRGDNWITVSIAAAVFLAVVLVLPGAESFPAQVGHPHQQSTVADDARDSTAHPGGRRVACRVELAPWE
jgi:hypothetical protein